jgi:ATP-dependent DNA ligase
MKRVKPANYQTIQPMEAKSVPRLLAGTNWVYEPKWDGFRCLALKDGKTVSLKGKSGKLLDRYFPEVREPIASIGLNKTSTRIYRP